MITEMYLVAGENKTSIFMLTMSLLYVRKHFSISFNKALTLILLVFVKLSYTFYEYRKVVLLKEGWLVKGGEDSSGLPTPRQVSNTFTSPKIQ